MGRDKQLSSMEFFRMVDRRVRQENQSFNASGVNGSHRPTSSPAAKARAHFRRGSPIRRSHSAIGTTSCSMRRTMCASQAEHQDCEKAASPLHRTGPVLKSRVGRRRPLRTTWHRGFDSRGYSSSAAPRQHRKPCQILSTSFGMTPRYGLVEPILTSREDRGVEPREKLRDRCPSQRVAGVGPVTAGGSG
jgi:hypothetical protein